MVPRFRHLQNACVVVLFVYLVILVFTQDSNYDRHIEGGSSTGAVDRVMVGRTPQGANEDWSLQLHMKGEQENSIWSKLTNMLISSNSAIPSNATVLHSDQLNNQDYIARFEAAKASNTVVNPHPFTYVIPPGPICADKDLFLLIYVHTAPLHYRQRMAIRATWGNPSNFRHIKTCVIFVMGITPSELFMQEGLYFEQEQYGDILQENFVDSYRNLTYKGIAALKYISTECRHVPFVLKTDDDIFVNIFSLIRHLQSLSKFAEKGVQNLLTCLLWYNMKAIRDERSKWYVPETEWRNDTFPPYCSGSAYVMSGDVATKMYYASFYTPFYWVDDLYITGFLPMRIGLKQKSISSTYILNFDQFEEKYKHNPEEGMTYIFSHVHDLDRVQTLWNIIASRRNGVLAGVDIANAWWKNDSLS